MVGGCLLTSNPGGSGFASVNFVVPGLLTTDTILAVTQKTPGAVPTSVMVGYSTQITNGLTVQYTADPGGSEVVIVTVLR